MFISDSDVIDLNEMEKKVMGELKDFQRCTVERINHLYEQGQKRILVSDEVGLGKTLIARGTIAKFIKLRKKEEDDLVKVIYICSNAAIAQQNLNKLRIVQTTDSIDSNTSRLSMQHLNIFEEENKNNKNNMIIEDGKVKTDYFQLIPLTPQTSFKITNSQGLAEERALMYSILKHLYELEGYVEQLSEFLSCGVGNWEYLINTYDSKVKSCNIKSKKHYLNYMTLQLINGLSVHKINGKKLLTVLKRYLEKCKLTSCDCRNKESRSLIIELRKVFTEISLEKLEPDLIIMDEFQRFKYLLETDSDSDIGVLTNKFFKNDDGKNSDVRILMLSATPYKMYSTLDELDETQVDEHYKEFFDVINFLKIDEDEKNKFKDVWSNYSLKLKEISENTDSFLCLKNNDSLISAKNDAEDSLYENICRTERIAEKNIADIIDDSDKDILLKVFKEDINSYIEFEKLLKSIDIDITSVPMDFIKSSPYLMSFMKSYKLKTEISDYFDKHLDEISKIKKDSFWINKSDIHNYNEIEFNHARLNHLMDNVLKDNAELLLWVPPSKEYYPSQGVFKDTNDFSKTLVFSSWEMVPRMISSLVSYEVERRTIGEFSKDNPNIKYFKQGNKSYNYTAPRNDYSLDKDKPRRMTLLSLIYPSRYLSMVYVPIECLNDNLSLKKIENKLRMKIKSKLDQFGEELDSHDNFGRRYLREDYRWYYLAALLLDCLDENSTNGNSDKKWYECTDYVLNWFKEYNESLKGDKGFPAHIKSLNETFNALVYYAKNEENEIKPRTHEGSNKSILKLGKKPSDLLDVLVDLAIASPANCIFRSYRRELSSYADLNLTISNENFEYDSNELLKVALANEMKKYAHSCSEIAFKFLSLMNTQEAMATIDYIKIKTDYWKNNNRKRDYWRNILTYSKDGNLQAVFDEYVYLLSNGLDKKEEERINIIHERFLESMNLNTTSYEVDTFENFKSEIEKKDSKSSEDDIEKKNLRTHFAVSFTKGISDNRDTNRKTSLRDTFNSPFRPFVLVSTSIGQEGLDFHNYCRRIVHWNLPSNPIDLEQREGRINRFACLAIRQNIAKRYGKPNSKFKNNIWIEMFEKASKNENTEGISDLIPFWGLRDPKDLEGMEDNEDMVKIERILPLYPFSRDMKRYDKLIKILSIYRLTLGQARQEELLEYILSNPDLDIKELKNLFINLSPYYR